jgi:hypothetical protein
VSGVVISDRLVVALTAGWLDAVDEREAWDVTWTRVISLAARSVWVVARRVEFMAWVSLMAAWAAPCYPAVHIIYWLRMSLSAALNCTLNLSQPLVIFGPIKLVSFSRIALFSRQCRRPSG